MRGASPPTLRASAPAAAERSIPTPARPSGRVPPQETDPVPVAYGSAQPRWFGVAPPSVLLALTLVGFVLALVLFGTGRWPLGLIAGGVALLLGTLFLEVAKRKPDAALTRRSREALVDARARAGSVIEALAIRSRAGREAALLRLELRRLYAARRDLLTAFGDAVYRGAHADGLRARLEELDDRARGLDAELHRLALETRDGIENARIAVQPTQMVPAVMISTPEPYPPPDEGNPAQPAIVPEPAPPPDEASAAAARPRADTRPRPHDSEDQRPRNSRGRSEKCSSCAAASSSCSRFPRIRRERRRRRRPPEGRRRRQARVCISGSRPCAHEAALSAQVKSVTTEIRALESRVGNVSTHLAALQQDIALHQRRLDKLNEALHDGDGSLRALREEYTVAMQRLDMRLVEIYKQRPPRRWRSCCSRAASTICSTSSRTSARSQSQDRRIAAEVKQARGGGPRTAPGDAPLARSAPQLRCAPCRSASASM